MLRGQTVLGADNDTSVPTQPWNNRQQTVKTAPHDEPSPVQRQEHRTGPVPGEIPGEPDGRSRKRGPVLPNDVDVLQVDVRTPDKELRSDLINGRAPGRNVLHRHGAEDTECLNTLEQGSGSAVIRRTGGERLMCIGHAATVAP